MSLNVLVDVALSDKAELESWLRAPTMPSGLVQRARIVLLRMTTRVGPTVMA